MAKVAAQPMIGVKITFTVSESEARALDALAGYGEDAFVKSFYEVLGEGYMKPHEAGLREFLGSIRDVVNPALARLNDAKLVFDAPYKKREAAKDAMSNAHLPKG